MSLYKPSRVSMTKTKAPFKASVKSTKLPKVKTSALKVKVPKSPKTPKGKAIKVKI